MGKRSVSNQVVSKQVGESLGWLLLVAAFIDVIFALARTGRINRCRVALQRMVLFYQRPLDQR